MSDTNKRSHWSPINELRNVENDKGEAKIIQVSRFIGLIQSSKIEFRSTHMNSLNG